MTLPPSGNALPQQETLGALPADGLLLPATAAGCESLGGSREEVWRMVQPRASSAGVSEKRGGFAAQRLTRGSCSNRTPSHLISHMGKRKGI